MGTRRRPAAVAMPSVAVLVLAAGASRRLGEPKQLLPLDGEPLLAHALDCARAVPAAQRLVTVGGPAEDGVRAAVDLAGFDVVAAPGAADGGCSSSIAAALAAIDPRCDVLVLLLGDQPDVRPEAVAALLAGRGDAPLAVCRYEDGRGHPFAFGRAAFGALAALRGDKAVWKLLEARADEVAEVAITGLVPRDVDTWDDYAAVLAGRALA